MIKLIVEHISLKDYTIVDICKNHTFLQPAELWRELNTPELVELTKEDTCMIRDMDKNLEGLLSVIPKQYILTFVSGYISGYFDLPQNLIYLSDKRSNFNKDMLYILQLFREALLHSINIYYLKIDLKQGIVYIPWSDVILEYIAEKIYIKDTIAISYTSKPYTLLPYDEIYDSLRYTIIPQLGGIVKYTGTSFIELSKNIYITGTTCSGKTLVSNYLPSYINKTFNKKYDSIILKNELFNTNTQLRYLINQITNDNITNANLAVIDGSPFDAIINSIIQTLCCTIRTRSDIPIERQIAKELAKIVSTNISSKFVNIMKEYQLLVMIGLDYKATRERLFLRNNHIDRKLAFNLHRLCIETITYCLFAYLGKWHMYDSACDSKTIDNINDSLHTSKDFLYSK